MIELLILLIGITIGVAATLFAANRHAFARWPENGLPPARATWRMRRVMRANRADLRAALERGRKERIAAEVETLKRMRLS